MVASSTASSQELASQMENTQVQYWNEVFEELRSQMQVFTDRLLHLQAEVCQRELQSIRRHRTDSEEPLSPTSPTASTSSKKLKRFGPGLVSPEGGLTENLVDLDDPEVKQRRRSAAVAEGDLDEATCFFLCLSLAPI